ncbi:MAG: CapA family protein [Nocardioides sp.]|nr:CapA family protein [Nocardioides sp.]
MRKAADIDDLVVVYLHWGQENDACPTLDQEALARSLAQAGADVVVGTHAHVPFGAGMLGGAYVSYGLGNFLWYHGRRSETGVLQLTVRGDEIVGNEWLPARIRPGGGNPQPLADEERAEAVADWRALRSCTDLAPGPGAGEQQAAATETSPEPAPAPAPAPSEGPSDDESADPLPAFTSTVRRIDPELRRTMGGSSHDPATCPVPLSDLRRLALSYVGFDGREHRGVMVVDADIATDVVGVFAALYEARFPIQRMRLIDAYGGGGDNRPMAANNTSGYNCRRVAGQDTFSDHAYDRAIDINPVQNPHVFGDEVLPPAGRGFVSDRDASAPARAGVIRKGDVVTRAFDRLGWTWGGDYTELDFQHFSAP